MQLLLGLAMAWERDPHDVALEHHRLLVGADNHPEPSARVACTDDEAQAYVQEMTAVYASETTRR